MHPSYIHVYINLNHTSEFKLKILSLGAVWRSPEESTVVCFFCDQTHPQAALAFLAGSLWDETGLLTVKTLQANTVESSIVQGTKQI
jgi:hypothetical protein